MAEVEEDRRLLHRRERAAFDIVLKVGVISAWLLWAAADGAFVPMGVVAAAGHTISLDESW